MVLHRAIQAARAGDLATLRELASSGRLASAADAQGAGPVHHAARCGRLECLHFLVSELGLAADARALNRATPAHDAAATGHIRELQWLADQGGCNIEVSLSTEDKLSTQREGEKSTRVQLSPGQSCMRLNSGFGHLTDPRVRLHHSSCKRYC